VLTETVERCEDAGLRVHLLPMWYDVDDAATLAMLEAELLEGKLPAFAAVEGYAAPHTKALLTEMTAVRRA
jgi:hypothetical protein